MMQSSRRCSGSGSLMSGKTAGWVFNEVHEMPLWSSEDPGSWGNEAAWRTPPQTLPPNTPIPKRPSAAIQCQLRSTHRHDSVPLRCHRCTLLSFCPSCWQLGNVAIFSSLLAGNFQHVFLCCLRKADLIKGPLLNPSHIFDVCEAWFKYRVEPELLRDERFTAGCDAFVHPW